MSNVECRLSSATPPRAADFKETLEGVGKRFRRVQTQRIYRRSIQRLIKLRQPFFIKRSEAFAHGAATGIKFKHFAGLGIFNREQPGVRQPALARIVQMQADQIVPRVRDAEFLDDIALGCVWWGEATDEPRGSAPVRGDPRPTSVALQKIRQQKNNRAPGQRVIQKRERGGNIRASLLWLEREHLTDNA